MKKVTSVIVALMMLFSICTVCASAAVNDAVLALRVTPTATSYNPGEEVTFEVSYESTADIGNVGICTLHIGYDSSVFELLEDASGSPDLDGSATVFFDGYALAGTVSLANSFIQTTNKLSAADTAKGWDTVLKIAMTQDGALFDASTETKAFAFKLKVKDTAAGGTYAVGVTDASIQDYSTFVNEELGAISGPSGAELEFSTGKVFDLADASVTVAGGSTPDPTPTVTVENLDTQAQWQDKDAGLMRVAFRGNIKGYDATTDLVTGSTTELNKLTEIGVMFSKTDSTPTKEEGATVVPAYTIYDFTTGGYFYRAVVGSIDYQSAETLYANAYIVLDGTTYTATNAVISTTGAAEYTRATGNGMAAK